MLINTNGKTAKKKKMSALIASGGSVYVCVCMLKLKPNILLILRSSTQIIRMRRGELLVFSAV